MVFYIIIPVFAMSVGYYFYKNSNKIVIKIFNKTSKLKLYAKSKLANDKDKLILRNAILIHSDKSSINVNTHFNISTNCNKRYIKKLTSKSFETLLNKNNVVKNENTRVLFTYYYNQQTYYLYWTGNNVTFDIKNTISNLKKTNIKLYTLLIVGMKGIKNITTKTIPNGCKLYIHLFKKLSGPINDYGYLLKCPIKCKWIYDDFGININEFCIEQGCKINEKMELDVFKYILNKNNENLIFDDVKNIELKNIEST